MSHSAKPTTNLLNKSFLRPTFTSKCKGEYQSLNKSYPKQHRQSSVQPSKPSKTIQTSQYNKVLQSLLNCNTLSNFKSIASKYIKFLQHKPISIQITNQNQQINLQECKKRKILGDNLLTDGLFIKHYCQLLLGSVQGTFVSHNMFRRGLYENHKDKIKNHENQFVEYFKNQRNKSLKKHSINGNISKNTTHYQDQHEEYQNNQQTADISSNVNDKLQVDKKLKSSYKSKTKRQPPIKRFELGYFDDQPPKHQRVYQSNKQRQQRYSGIHKSGRQPRIVGRKTQFIQFEDLLKTDKRLQQIHAEVTKKQQEKRASMHSAIKQDLLQIERLFAKVKDQGPRVRDLTPSELNKLTPIQREIISKCINIEFIAYPSKVEIVAEQFLGSLKGYLIYLVGVREKLFFLGNDDYQYYKGITLRQQQQESIHQDYISDEQVLPMIRIFVQNNDITSDQK